MPDRRYPEAQECFRKIEEENMANVHRLCDGEPGDGDWEDAISAQLARSLAGIESLERRWHL